MVKAGQLVTWAAMCSMTVILVDCNTMSPSLEADLSDLAHYVTKRPADYDDHTNASSVERMIRADMVKAIDDWNLAPETPEPEFDSDGNRKTPEPKIPQFWNAYRQEREGDRPSSWDNSEIDYESCLRRKNQEWTPSQESSPYNGSTHEPFTWRTHYNTSSVEDDEVWTQPTLDTIETLENSQLFHTAGRKAGHVLPVLMNPHRNNIISANNRRLKRRKQPLKQLLHQAINGQRPANGMKPDMKWSEVPRSHRRKYKQLHAERMRLRDLEKFEKNNIMHRNNYKQQMSALPQQRSSPLLTNHIIRTVGLRTQLQSS